MGLSQFQKNAYSTHICSESFHFTKREIDILDILSDVTIPDHSNKALAKYTDLTVGTIKIYLARLMAKMGTDRSGLTLIGYKIRQGNFDVRVYFYELVKAQEQKIRNGSSQPPCNQPPAAKSEFEYHEVA